MNDLTYNEDVQDLVDTNDVHENINDEKEFISRDYQTIAITQLTDFLKKDDNETIGLLNMPCGTGKTIVVGKCLKLISTSYQSFVYVVISPYRDLTKQNFERISRILLNYIPVLVDSDYSFNSTRNINNIVETINGNHKKVFISATYKSAEDVLTNVFDKLNKEEVIFIVDEAHNLQNNEILLKLCQHQSIYKTILMTATPPNTMITDVMNSKLVYHYSMNEAIQQRYICDYCVYLPLEFVDKVITLKDSDKNENENEEIDNNENSENSENSENGENDENSSSIVETTESRKEFDVEIQDIFFNYNKCDGEMIKMALYLINGMLKTGCRKCIGYFRTIEECTRFCLILETVIKKYHYLECWTNSITAEISTRNRLQVISDFKNNSKQFISILCSIRILDEGIDIPCCDSIFLSNIHDNSSTIRTVQRICRANRLDKSNPQKIANIFLWCDENLQFLNAFKLLRENDIRFESKLRCVSQNYTIQDNTINSRCTTNEKMNVFCRWFNMKAMNLEDLRVYRLQLFTEFVNEQKRIPKSTEEYNSWKIGIWFTYQKKKIENNQSEMYRTLSTIHPIIKEKLDWYLSEKEKNKDKITYTYNQKLELFTEFINEQNKIPYNNVVYKSCEIGRWLSAQKKKIKNNQSEMYIILSKIHPMIKEQLDRRIASNTKSSSMQKFFLKNNMKPICFQEKKPHFFYFYLKRENKDIEKN